MPSGQTLHAEAVRFYKERGLMSQKDLMRRKGYNSVRSVQRFRKEFGLLPASFWGVNPLFTLEAVELAEAAEEKKRLAMLKRKMARARACKLISIKQARRRAGRRRK